MTDADIRFYFDPVCPFAWMTSKWVRMVAAQRDYTVDWRFISLRLINSAIDYDSHFPAGYEEGHDSGLRLLRVAARARAEYGRAAVGPFYETVSSEIFDAPGAAEPHARDPGQPRLRRAAARQGRPARRAGGRARRHAVGRRDPRRRRRGALTDRQGRRHADHPLQSPGRHCLLRPGYQPAPGPEDAVRLWDHVTGLAGFPGFAELKRSLRERPQLRSFGVEPGTAGAEEDWHAGSRKPAS